MNDEDTDETWEEDLDRQIAALTEVTSEWLEQWDRSAGRANLRPPLPIHRASERYRDVLDRIEVAYAGRCERFLQSLEIGGTRRGDRMDPVGELAPPPPGWLAADAAPALDEMRTAMELFQEGVGSVATLGDIEKGDEIRNDPLAAFHAVVEVERRAGAQMADAGDRLPRAVEALPLAVVRSIDQRWERGRRLRGDLRERAFAEAMSAVKEAREKRSAAPRGQVEAPAGTTTPRWVAWAVAFAFLGVVIGGMRYLAEQERQERIRAVTATTNAPTASASAVRALRVRVKPTDVHIKPGFPYEVVESLSAPVSAEVIDGNSQKEWVKIRLPSGKIGWVPYASLFKRRGPGAEDAGT